MEFRNRVGAGALLDLRVLVPLFVTTLSGAALVLSGLSTRWFVYLGPPLGILLLVGAVWLGYSGLSIGLRAPPLIDIREDAVLGFSLLGFLARPGDHSPRFEAIRVPFERIRIILDAGESSPYPTRAYARLIGHGGSYFSWSRPTTGESTEPWKPWSRDKEIILSRANLQRVRQAVTEWRALRDSRRDTNAST